MQRSDKDVVMELFDSAGFLWGNTGGNGIELNGTVFSFNGADALIGVDGSGPEEFETEKCSECSALEETIEEIQKLAQNIVDL